MDGTEWQRGGEIKKRKRKRKKREVDEKEKLASFSGGEGERAMLR